MKHKIVSLFLTLCFISAVPLMASAQSFNPQTFGEMSIIMEDNSSKTPLEGVSVSVYYVASVKNISNGELTYAYTDKFKYCDIKHNDPDIIQKLETFAQENSVWAYECVTDADGKAELKGLPLGLYLVKQTNTVPGYAQCESFFVAVPYKDGDNFVYSATAYPKTDIERLVDITIKKVWNTDQSTKVPDKVTVNLLMDGVVVETATLSKSNNWKVTFTDMPQSDAYAVEEVNVPNGFTATYANKDYIFTVTNTAALIKTGQLIWPVPILAMAGIVFITLGVVSLKKQEDSDE